MLLSESGFPNSLYSQGTHLIAPQLSAIYREHLEERGLYEKARNYKDAEVVGGVTKEEAEDHYCWRFLNSASRMVRLLVDTPNRFSEERQSILSCMSMSRVALLDIPCGTGATTLSLLTTLAELRGQSAPMLPLTVNIVGGDISEHALEIYNQLLPKIKPVLAKNGIFIEWNTQSWDATQSDQTALLCNEWLAAQYAANEYLVVVSNFSGASKSLLTSFQRSFQHIGERMVHVPATLLWIEPRMKNTSKIREKLENFMMHIPKLRNFIDSKLVPWADYYWSCPISGKEGIKSSLEVVGFVKRNTP